MSDQMEKRIVKGIVGSCEWCIEFLKTGKRTLIDANFVKSSIFGVIVMLITELLQICNDVFSRKKDETSNAKNDLKEIKGRFDQFFNKMIGDIDE